MVVAHRGASGTTPENTLFAIETAMADFADIVEIDVQLSKDGEVVLFHDRTLERITGSPNRISDYSLVELKKLDVGSWMDPQFSGLQISTLAEVLEKTNGHSLIVEIKTKGESESRDLGMRVLESLDDSEGIGQGYISVRDVETLNWFRDQDSRYRLGLMQKRRSSTELFEIMKKIHLDIIQIRSISFDQAAYHKLAKYHGECFVYWADTPQEWEYLSHQPITGILTNYPARMRSHFLSQVKVES